MSSNKQIEATAAEWLARRDRGDWNDAGQAALSEWLRTSTAHRVAYLRLEAAWQQAGRLKALGAGVAPNLIPPPGAWAGSPFFDVAPPESPPPESTPRKAPHRWIYGIAASLVLCALGPVVWHFYGPQGASYETAVGGLEAVPLAGGSHIALNSGSEVEVTVTAKERRVELNHGEAFFEVAKDPSRPFVVRAGNARVIAVGTQFSVRRDGEDVEVVVIEGRVRVERDAEFSKGSPPTLLAAGGVARSDGSGVLVEQKPIPEAEEILSW